MEKQNKKLIEELFEKGILVSKEMLDNGLSDNVVAKIESEADLLVLTQDYQEIIRQDSFLIDWYELDSYRVDSEKHRNDDLYQTQLQTFQTSRTTIEQTHQTQETSSLEAELDVIDAEGTFSTTNEVLDSEDEFEITEKSSTIDSSEPSHTSITIVLSHENTPRKHTVDHFTKFFISRYRFLEGLLRNRQELQNTTTIGRLQGKRDREAVSIIGIVTEIGETKNKNLILTLEDLTGQVKVLVSNKNQELLESAKDIVVDEVIGISGVGGAEIIFADTIVWPDVPHNRELRKGPEEEYAIFLSDIHVGSKLFMKDAFKKFLQWVNGKVGNETQQHISSRVKYIFIAGDLVDGVGIYPGQEDELEITDIKEQYAEFARLLQEIPLDKQIIICPGNHDVVHLAEPQPVLYREYAEDLYQMPNVKLVTNPAVINIGKTDDFAGFDVLMYHGYSFDYYVANVESIRNNGGYHRADLIMKFLLKRRHLAPSFASTPYFPGEEDPLLIKQIPDIFITGHIHYSGAANYRGVTMITGSCWQACTSFQEKLGHSPEPGRVPVVNLKTREVKVLRFV